MSTYRYRPVESSKFKKTRKLAEKRGCDMRLLQEAIIMLAKDMPLPSSWRDHQLKGKLKKYRECHLGGSGDWLLVYEKRNRDMILYLVGTGSHQDLLG